MTGTRLSTMQTTRTLSLFKSRLKGFMIQDYGR